MNYTPDLRTPIVQMFAPWKYHPVDCPRSFTDEWENEDSADVYMSNVLERFSQTDRGIMAMPMGKIPGFYPSSQWHTGEKWRQDLIVDKCNNWLRGKIGRTISLFTGCRVSRSPYHLSMVGAIPPNPTNPEVMSRFVPNLLQWVSRIKIHRLFLDHASHPSNYPAVLRLAQWCHSNWGLTIGIEAFRTVRVGSEWILDEDSLDVMPGYAMSQFIMPRDPDGDWICPPGAEALAICRGVESPTQEWVDSLRERGFTVGSISPQCDELVV